LDQSFWVEALGLIAACLTTAAYLPQVIKTWRTRSAGDVSLIMYLMLTLGIALWLTYGLLIGSVPLIFSNTVTFALVGAMLWLKLFGRRS